MISNQRPADKPEAGASPPASARQEGTDLRQLPLEMQVAIDGTSTVTRRPIGELVALALRAVLVDSGRLYRALAKSCLEAGLDLEDSMAVSEYCGKARLDVWVRRQTGDFEEALLFVNGDIFNNDELVAVHADTPKIAFTPVARGQVSRVVRELAGHGRVVVLGRDIGARVLPWTPFKFFVNTPAGMLLRLSTQDYEPTFDFSYRSANRNNTIQTWGTMQIDGGLLSPAQACNRILAELPQQQIRRQREEKEWLELMSPYR